MSNRTIKQVIVMRKDLKMRRGKEIAQGAHASLSFLSRSLKLAPAGNLNNGNKVMETVLSPAEKQWLEGSFTKICLQVNSEQELMDIHMAASKAGLVSFLITDSGKTEFNGIPTKTCLAIGPDYEDTIDPITGLLKLY